MAALEYRGYTFPGYNKPIAAPRGDKHKRMVLVRKGARTKLVRYGLRGMEDYTQHGDRARRKSYLARSAGIRDKRGRLTKDDIFSANYWARRDLWAANPHQRDVTENPIMKTNFAAIPVGTVFLDESRSGMLMQKLNDELARFEDGLVGIMSASDPVIIEGKAKTIMKNPREDIFGYSFEDIQRAQQKKGRLQKTVDLSVPVTHALMPGDMELLEKHGIDGLRAMQFFGVVDRLERNGIVPKRNPRKQSYAAEFDSMMGRESFEGMMKPKDDYINLGGDRVKNDKKSILRHVQKTYPNVKDVRNDPQYGWVPVFGNPRRSATVHASDKYLLQMKHGAKWKTLHSASSPELLKEDAQVLRKAGLRSAMQVIKK